MVSYAGALFVELLIGLCIESPSLFMSYTIYLLQTVEADMIFQHLNHQSAEV